MRTPSWHINMETAIDIAMRASDDYCLPQTIYRNEDTCGWANTCSQSRCLDKSEMFVTVLPERYFR